MTIINMQRNLTVLLLDRARSDNRLRDVTLLTAMQGEIEQLCICIDELATLPEPFSNLRVTKGASRYAGPAPFEFGTIVNHIDVSAALSGLRDNADAVRRILQNEVVKQVDRTFDNTTIAVTPEMVAVWMRNVEPEMIRAVLEAAHVDGNGYRTRPPYNGGVLKRAAPTGYIHYWSLCPGHIAPRREAGKFVVGDSEDTKMSGERNDPSENANHPASAPQPVHWHVTVRGNEDIEAILFGIRAHRDWSKISVKLVQPYPGSAGACAARFAPPPQYPKGTLIVEPNQFASFTFGLGQLKTNYAAEPVAGFGFFEFQESDEPGARNTPTGAFGQNPVIRMEFTDTAAVLQVVNDLTKLALQMSGEQS